MIFLLPWRQWIWLFQLCRVFTHRPEEQEPLRKSFYIYIDFLSKPSQDRVWPRSLIPVPDPASLSQFNWVRAALSSIFLSFLLFWKFLEVRKTGSEVKIDIVWLWCNPSAVFISFSFCCRCGRAESQKRESDLLWLHIKPALMRGGSLRVNQVENEQGWIIFRGQSESGRSEAAAQGEKTSLGFPSVSPFSDEQQIFTQT